jgi:hypothetical protein
MVANGKSFDGLILFTIIFLIFYKHIFVFVFVFGVNKYIIIQTIYINHDITLLFFFNI